MRVEEMEFESVVLVGWVGGVERSFIFYFYCGWGASEEVRFEC